MATATLLNTDRFRFLYSHLVMVIRRQNQMAVLNKFDNMTGKMISHG